jgi:hypothetical protein
MQAGGAGRSSALSLTSPLVAGESTDYRPIAGLVSNEIHKNASKGTHHARRMRREARREGWILDTSNCLLVGHRTRHRVGDHESRNLTTTRVDRGDRGRGIGGFLRRCRKRVRRLRRRSTQENRSSGGFYSVLLFPSEAPALLSSCQRSPAISSTSALLQEITAARALPDDDPDDRRGRVEADEQCVREETYRRRYAGEWELRRILFFFFRRSSLPSCQRSSNLTATARGSPTTSAALRALEVFERFRPVVAQQP